MKSSNSSDNNPSIDNSKTGQQLSSSDLLLAETIFKRLDKNGDGKICLSDLVEALNHQNQDAAERIFRSLSSNNQENISFSDFIEYFLQQDKKISIAFQKLDKGEKLSEEDIRNAFSHLGMPLTNIEAERLIKRISPDGTWQIDYNEWRTFLLFHICEDFNTTMLLWRTAGFFLSENDADNGEGNIKTFLTTGCAAVSAAISRTATAPLDRIRIMRQVYGYKHTDSHFWDVGRYMIREGGFFSMWRGNGTNLMKIVPEHAIKLSVYRKVRMYLHGSDNPEDQSAWVTFLSGSIGGTAAQGVVYPMEVVKTRMCLRKTNQYSSIADCIRFILKDGGIRAFYRGYFISLCGVIPCTGIEMGLYDTCRKILLRKYFPDKSEPPVFFAIPLIGFSISVAMLVTYPLQLIRTKFQSKSHFTYEEANNVRGLVRTIYRTEGMRGFYRGLAPNFLKVIPAYAISYVVFEMLNKKFNLNTFGGRK